MFNLFGSETKELIVNYLIKNPNKTIKEINSDINSIYNQINYKNLHKTLTILCDEKIISKKDSKYYLSSEFIEYIKKFSDNILDNYTNEMFVRNKTDLYNVMLYLDPKGKVKSKVSDYLNTWLMEKLDDWYSKFYDPENIEFKKIQESIESKFGRKKNLKVLEIGCGTGRVTEKLNSEYKEVVAIDINERYITYCKKKYNDITFECSDITNYEAKYKFDVIVFSWIGLHYQENIDKILENIQKMINNNSIIIILDAYYETEFMNILQMLRPIDIKKIKMAKEKLNDKLVSIFGNLKNEIILNHYEFDSVKALIDNFKIELTLEESRVWTKEDENKIKEYVIKRDKKQKLKIGEGFFLSIIEV